MLIVWFFSILRREGFKSRAFVIMLCAFGCMAVIGIIGAGMSRSIESTNKYSFRAVGLLHRKGDRDRKRNKLFLDFIGNETVKNLSNSANTTKDPSFINSTTEINLMDLYQSSKNDSSLDLQRNQTNLEIEVENDLNDLLLFSSFDCFLTFPSSITDYINNTFIEQFNLSHVDIFSDQHENEQELPLLKSVFTSCYADQICTTFFEYDKQYGIDTSHDNVIQVNDIFHCCSYDQINQTSETCKKAKPSIEKSILSHSKRPVLMVSDSSILVLLHKY